MRFNDPTCENRSGSVSIRLRIDSKSLGLLFPGDPLRELVSIKVYLSRYDYNVHVGRDRWRSSTGNPRKRLETKVLPSHSTGVRRTGMLAVLVVAAVFGNKSPNSPPCKDVVEWSSYGHDEGGTKYSPVDEINRFNVGKLHTAWTYRSGSIWDFWKPRPRHEATPIYVDGTLFFATAFGRVVALNPDTGKERWVYDSHLPVFGRGYGDFANRGIATWLDETSKQRQPCRRRIFFTSIDARLIALDAYTGLACSDFGTDGQIDLTSHLRRPPNYVTEYAESSPPAILHNLVIVGSAVKDNTVITAASGEVRAFDARTGKLCWRWDPISDISRTGAANAWSAISVDTQRNLVFVPTGSASPDYFGGYRKGDNRFADSVVALRGDTGQLVWGFQTVHHDLWDYDVAAQPLLLQSGSHSAVAVGSKTGNIFFLDRETGKPLLGVTETPVPKSDIPEEETSPTQPIPKMPKPLLPPPFTTADIRAENSVDQHWCTDQMKGLRMEGVFTPPTVRGSLIVPGSLGGVHWGGEAYDPKHHLLIVPSNRVPAVVHLIPRASWEREARAHPERDNATPQQGAPYGMSRFFLIAPDGLPCSPPPWGTLTAIDTDDGSRRWEIPLGHLPNTPAAYGSPNLGGPIVTAGGLVFISATLDPHIRAVDVETGKELWETELPAKARSTPMTYRTTMGKQYVVITAGSEEELSDTLVAFALPSSHRSNAPF